VVDARIGYLLRGFCNKQITLFPMDSCSPDLTSLFVTHVGIITNNPGTDTYELLIVTASSVVFFLSRMTLDAALIQCQEVPRSDGSRLFLWAPTAAVDQLSGMVRDSRPDIVLYKREDIRPVGGAMITDADVAPYIHWSMKHLLLRQRDSRSNERRGLILDGISRAKEWGKRHGVVAAIEYDGANWLAAVARERTGGFDVETVLVGQSAIEAALLQIGKTNHGLTVYATLQGGEAAFPRLHSAAVESQWPFIAFPRWHKTGAKLAFPRQQCITVDNFAAYASAYAIIEHHCKTPVAERGSVAFSEEPVLCQVSSSSSEESSEDGEPSCDKTVSSEASDTTEDGDDDESLQEDDGSSSDNLSSSEGPPKRRPAKKQPAPGKRPRPPPKKGDPAPRGRPATKGVEVPVPEPPPASELSTATLHAAELSPGEPVALPPATDEPSLIPKPPGPAKKTKKQ